MPDVDAGPRPVIFAVTADAAAGTCVDEELHKRYAADYAVMSAASVDDAHARLTALRTLGGTPRVALMLAGYGRADPDGLEFLRDARAVDPATKRVALLRWGEFDTGPAVAEAQALGIIDHWLLVPEQARDEEFHRGVAELLEEWASGFAPRFEALRIVGDPTAPRSAELRDLLSRSHVPFGFYAARLGPWLAAAVYASSEGLSTVLIEGGAIGGQAGSTSFIRNYLGFPRGVPGAKLAFSAYHQAWTFGTSFVFMRGARVLIVGGGNSAGQAAVHVAHYASEVTVLVRQPTLAASMSDYLVRALDAAPNIRVRFETAVLDASGDRRLERVTVRDRRSGVSEELDADALFLLIGSRPRTDWLTGVARDDWGFVLTGNDVTSLPEPVWPLERPPFAYEASIPGVFAVGDVRRGSVKRVASSVGEGSVVVSMIHEQRSLAGEVLVHSS